MTKDKQEKAKAVSEVGQEEQAAGVKTAEAGGASAANDSAEVAVLKQALEEAQRAKADAEAKSKEYFEGWQRERADFSNYKRRIERDQLTLSQSITGEILKKYLLVLDDMDRAVRMRPADGDLTTWAGGIELIYRKLQMIIDQEGIKRIPAETEEFNPLRHEAITYEDSPDHASGAIIGVVQEGYILGDRVLRPARVRVAR
jgi:molecular chaperone GrpE